MQTEDTAIDGQSFTPRAAEARDLATIVQLKLAMFDEAGRARDLAPDAAARMLGAYRGLYARGRARHFVVEHEGEIIACAGAFLKDDFPFCFYRVSVYGYLGDVYTRPSYRRRGLARRLTTEAIGWLRDQGVDTVRLLATAQGQPLYAELGFRPAGDMVLSLG
jgi:GNAT superfamily N-acetyltransferase